MAFEQKDLTGALFKNKKKTDDKHADYTGTVRVDGTDYFLDAWIKKSQAGETFMSLRLKPKNA
jgi:uncharacterized protein (DUF736 family)